MTDTFSQEKLKQELCKLKPMLKKKAWVSYNDVGWFLLKYYMEKEGLK